MQQITVQQTPTQQSSFQVPSHLMLLKHPFYQAWMEGTLSRPVLQDYVKQYFHHVEAFPRYLENAIQQSKNDTKNEQTTTILSENLAEENGEAYGTSHPELWLRFAEGLDVSRNDVLSANLRPGIENVVKTFTGFSKSSLPEALGSLYAYESQVPEIAHSKIEGLKKNYGIDDERTLSFFEVHKHADVEHRESLLRIIESLPEDQKARANLAAEASSQALWNFLSDVQDAHA